MVALLSKKLYSSEGWKTSVSKEKGRSSDHWMNANDRVLDLETPVIYA